MPVALIPAVMVADFAVHPPGQLIVVVVAIALDFNIFSHGI
jgi:hypothetical protein